VLGGGVVSETGAVALAVLALLVLVAALAPIYGADSRPGIDEPAEPWIG
jgi:hypothetical protein